LFGLAPALRLSCGDAGLTLRSGGRGGLDPARGRLHRALVGFEIALSLILLVGAALAVESFLRLRQVRTGYDPWGVLTFHLSTSGPRYETPAARAAFVETVLERVRALPDAHATPNDHAELGWLDGLIGVLRADEAQPRGA
jgi:hypothetical protein